MRRIGITLHTHSPVAVGVRATYGQQFLESLDYIPGRTWRGAVAHNILECFCPGGAPTMGACAENSCPLNADGTCYFPTVFTGDEPAIFTNLYYVHGDEASFVSPLPLCTFGCKRFPGSKAQRDDETAKAHDRDERARYAAKPPTHGLWDALVKERDRCSYEGCGAETQHLDSGYLQLVPRNDQLIGYLRRPARERLTKVALNRRRLTAEDGMLYSVSALQANQRFSGYLLLPDALPEPIVLALRTHLQRPSSSICVGGGVSRGLGRVRFEMSHSTRWLTDIQDRLTKLETIVTKSQVPIPADAATRTGTWFSLTLAADAVLRSPLTQAPQVGWTDEVVTSCLRDTMPSAPTITIVNAFARRCVVSGWQNAWHLPRFTELGTAAGSACLCWLPITDQAERAGVVEALEHIELTGVGSRREEGLGQVIVCHPFHCGEVST